MKWLASLLLITIVALAVFATAPNVQALGGGHTPIPTASGTPISINTTPTPHP